MQALRSMYWVKLSVRADAARAASTSPVSWWCRAATLSGHVLVHGVHRRAGGVHADHDRQLLVGDA